MASIKAEKISKLCITVVYRVGEEIRTFKAQLTSGMLIERFIQLESGNVDGLFIPVGKGQQVSAKNVEWFEILRPAAECNCPDQYGDYLS